MVTVDAIIDGILVREDWSRGLINVPSDEGGWTKGGITLATLSDWLGRPATIEELRDLPLATARLIYRKVYIEAPGFLAIADEALRVAVIDAGVHHGTRRAIRFLQRVLGVEPVSGYFGPLTRSALRARDPNEVRRLFLRTRLDALVETALAEVDPKIVQATDLKFLKGWGRRVLEFAQ